jgi:hypothetical protein
LNSGAIGLLVAGAMACADKESGEDSTSPSAAACAARTTKEACEGMLAPDEEPSPRCLWYDIWRVDPDTCEFTSVQQRCARASYIGDGCGVTTAPNCDGEPPFVSEDEAGFELWRAPGTCNYFPGTYEEPDATECPEVRYQELPAAPECACGCPP